VKETREPVVPSGSSSIRQTADQIERVGQRGSVGAGAEAVEIAVGRVREPFRQTVSIIRPKQENFPICPAKVVW
jgi:hypothetical protein